MPRNGTILATGREIDALQIPWEQGLSFLRRFQCQAFLSTLSCTLFLAFERQQS